MPREKKTNRNGANLGFEAQLWQAADALRGGMDAAYEVVLGLIFLKSISDAFEEQLVFDQSVGFTAHTQAVTGTAAKLRRTSASTARNPTA